MVRTQVGFAVCLYGVGPRILVRSSSWAGLLAGSEHSGIGGLPHVAGVSRENVGYRVYMAQGNLERIIVEEHTVHSWYAESLSRNIFLFTTPFQYYHHTVSFWP